MDEKYMRREVMTWLGTLILIFTAGLVFMIYLMTERMYTISKDKEYRIVGSCFHYIFSDTIVKLKGFAESTSYELGRYIAEKEEDKISSFLQNLMANGVITGAVVTTNYGRQLFSSFDKVPSQISGRILTAIKDKKSSMDVVKFDGKIVALAVAPVFHGSEFLGVVALTKVFDNVIRAAEEKMGGNFELVSWEDIPEISEKLKKVEYLAIRRKGKIMVYYDVYNGKYFAHWTETDERWVVMGKAFLIAVLFNVPLFTAVLYFTTFFRRRIVSEFIDPLRKTIDALDDLVSTTSSSSQELAASSEELAASTEALEDSGRHLSDLAQGMLQDLERTEGFSEDVSEFASFLERSIGDLERLSGELGESMQEIHKMGGLIQQIGERIVVLSINASIESSRDTIDRQAIRALADEIGNLSETTTERVSKIFASLQGSREKLDDMNTALRDIMSETKRLAERTNRLLNMVRGNKGEFKKVSETIQSMFTSIEEVNFASQNLAEAATELSQKSYEVQKVVDELFISRSSGEGENQEEEG